MAKIIGIQKPWCITIRKKFGRAVYDDEGGLYGVSSFGLGSFGIGQAQPDEPFHGVYQMRKCAEGKIPIRMKFYKPKNPKTEAQTIVRNKLKAGVIAWQSLTQSQKKVYNELAKGKQLTGYNVFMKKYLLE